MSLSFTEIQHGRVIVNLKSMRVELARLTDPDCTAMDIRACKRRIKRSIINIENIDSETFEKRYYLLKERVHMGILRCIGRSDCMDEFRRENLQVRILGNIVRGGR